MIPELDTSRFEPVRCMNCGYLLDATTGEGHPSPGDVSICIECLNIALFTHDMALRAPTAAELREIMAEPEVRRYLMAIRQMKQK